MNPQRRFFQIHLSTAVVLMLVAGVLVWENVPSYEGLVNTSLWPDGKHLRERYIHREYGWPFSFARSYQGDRSEEGAPTVLNSFQWTIPELIFDILIALILLSSVWYFCEGEIARRAARKANE